MLMSNPDFAGVVHQSPPIVYLPKGEQAIPLYCVASNHTVLNCYRWESSGVSLPGSSPVLWVQKAGVYKCSIKEMEDASSPQCVSRDIAVRSVSDVFTSHSSDDCTITRIEPVSTRSSSNHPLDSFVKGECIFIVCASVSYRILSYQGMQWCFLWMTLARLLTTSQWRR